MDSTNKEAIAQYYDPLEEKLQEHDLMYSAEIIYNMNESGISLDPQLPNIIAKRSQNKVRYHSSCKKEQIMVLGFVNTIGQAIPLMEIFHGKYQNLQWTTSEVPSTYCGMSSKGCQKLL